MSSGTNTFTPSPICAVCGTSSNTQCAQCKQIHYCSKKCQKIDFKIHKIFCHSGTTPENIYPPKEPGKDTVRGIFFPVDEDTPRFVEVPFVWTEQTGERRRKLKLELICGPDVVHYLFVTENIVRNKELTRYGLSIWGRDTAMVDGSKSNQSIVRVTGGGNMLDWPRGPILAMKTGPLYIFGVFMDPDFVDTGVAELRDVVDYFKAYGRSDIDPEFANPSGNWNLPMGSKPDPAVKSAASQSIQSEVIQNPSSKLPKATAPSNPLPKSTAGSPALSKPVKGVMIHCIGDQEIYKRPKFEEKLISPAEQLKLLAEGTPPISALISLDIKLLRCSKVSDMRNMKWLPDNQPATFLNVNPADGWAPFSWQNQVGSTLVMRKDKKDLTIELLEVLCEFCQFHLGPMFEAWFEAETEQLRLRRRQLLDRTMTKEGFEKFFEEKRLERIYFEKEMMNLSLD